MNEHKRQEDAYIKPRYPVDEPPTYRAQCSCGWTGPERYRGITDTDWNPHVAEERDAALLVAARDDERQRWVTAVEELAEEWDRYAERFALVLSGWAQRPDLAEALAFQRAADRLRGLVPSEVTR